MKDSKRTPPAGSLQLVTEPEDVEALLHRQAPQVLSVDLFDTLVYRRCKDPHAVFFLQHQKIADLLPLHSARDWVSVRVRVERDLSEAAQPNEIHLKQVYVSIAEQLMINQDTADHLLNAELAAEREVIRPYSRFITILHKWYSAGTIICVTTDTYLPVEFIRSLLDQILPFRYHLLCSSETLRPKRSRLAFFDLVKTFPSSSILHLGDNPVSDISRAANSGIRTCLVDWGRDRFLKRNAKVVRYLEELGVFTFDTPVELFLPESVTRARHELAWRWAAILCDFLICIKHSAQTHAVDEIWFLSRDCEALYRAIRNQTEFFSGVETKYIYTSRAATYPIVAAHRPDLFNAWIKRPITSADVELGKLLVEHYQESTSKSTQRIMIVDNGWKGRIQSCLALALSQLEVRGFYFSLDEFAEIESSKNADLFVEWNSSLVNQAAVEALAGFQTPTCTGYVRDEQGTISPLFGQSAGDVCPADYSDALFNYLNEFIGSLASHPNKKISALRRKILRETMSFPDKTTAEAFKGWGIAAAVSGAIDGFLIDGGLASRKTKLAGRMDDGNLWPPLALWSVFQGKKMIRLLQSLIYTRKWLKHHLLYLRNKTGQATSVPL